MQALEREEAELTNMLEQLEDNYDKTDKACTKNIENKAQSVIDREEQ